MLCFQPIPFQLFKNQVGTNYEEIVIRIPSREKKSSNIWTKISTCVFL